MMPRRCGPMSLAPTRCSTARKRSRRRGPTDSFSCRASRRTGTTARPVTDGRSVARTARDVGTGAVTAADVVRSAMAAIVNGESGPRRLNAFISFAYEAAVDAAAAIDERVAAGAVLPLAGVPVAVKDNICTADLPTTCGSRMLARLHVAVRRHRSAPAAAGRSRHRGQDEPGRVRHGLVHGALGVRPTCNPYDRSRVAGGSSGGSAAAVAAGMVPAALGSDTGGSVRQPAAFCGVVGIRPTWGRVSRYGLVAHASSLDQVGVLGRTVADAARVLHVIAGADARDMTAAARAVPDLVAAAEPDPDAGAAPLAGLVVGVPAEYLDAGLHPGVRSVCDRAAHALRALGATVREVSLPHTRHALPAYTVIAAAEASANLARFDGVRFGARVAADTAPDACAASRGAGLGAEVRRRIVLGTFVLSGGWHAMYYDTARRVRTLVARDFHAVFAAGTDLLLTPTTPEPAFAVGERTGDPYAMYRSDVFTVPAALAGVPALSLPAGTADGLPVGVQLVAPRWAEAELLAAAACLEAATAP
jgi:aspartyl-tRNA(Asn)/glutamyl-tRNA(Gln) amidotransferase subunit A